VVAFDMPLRCDELTQTLRVHPDRSGQVTVTLASQKHLVRIIDFKDGSLRFEIDGVTRTAVAVKHQQELHVALGGASFVFHEVSPFPSKDAALDATRALSPVAGKVTQIQFAVGEGVQQGQALVCVEAMKMEMWLTAQAAGTVVALHVKVGEQVESGALLIEIELEDQKET
jgi:geranyl-CoA carboxylase alpha subunit